MKHTVTAVTSAAALLCLSGMVAGTGPTTAAAATAPRSAAAQQTMKIVARELASKQLGSNYLVQTDKVLRHGHVLGFAASNCTFDFATSTAACDVAISFKKGQLRAHVHVHADDNTLQGSITGGTGAYRGASGTVTGKPGSRPGDERITLIYTT